MDFRQHSKKNLDGSEIFDNTRKDLDGSDERLDPAARQLDSDLRNNDSLYSIERVDSYQYSEAHKK